MKVAVFSTRSFERPFLDAANRTHKHGLVYLDSSLTRLTVPLAKGFPVVSAFVSDTLDRAVLEHLSKQGIRLIALRSAVFNNVDVEAAEEFRITVVRVPAYSPYVVAEHTVDLILTLNRKRHRAFVRVREQNFSLDGLLGFDLKERTVGIIGTGKIGAIVARIMVGFGCRILAHDPVENAAGQEFGVQYVSLLELAEGADIITLHCPLTPETHHMIDGTFLEHMKPGVMVINTSRGALINTKAVIKALKSGIIGYLGLDVYEEEADLFFRDLSDQVIQDDVSARLLTFPNGFVTAHQGFSTREALTNIAKTTIENITDFERGALREEHCVTGRHVREAP